MQARCISAKSDCLVKSARSPQADARLKEAQKLGFTAACLPRRLAQGGRKPAALPGLRLNEMGHLAELVAGFTKP